MEGGGEGMKLITCHNYIIVELNNQMDRLTNKKDSNGVAYLKVLINCEY